MIRRLCLLLALASPAWADHFHAVKHHVQAAAVVQSAVSYDTSIGTAVDANGRASLPLHAGASRYYVNSSTGSDTNTCTQAKSPTTPKATISSGQSCLVGGNGDQLLIAQGTSYTGALVCCATSGFSAQYPTVYESYDPADPTNEAKLGTAGTAGRPILNTGGSGENFVQGSSSYNYVAVRGLDWEPPRTALLEITMAAPADPATANYFLWENNIFHYTALNYNGNPTLNHARSTKWIIRGNALSSEFGDHAQGVFISNVDGFTAEDNVFGHSGWNNVGSSSFTASISAETLTVSAGSNIAIGQLISGAGIDSRTFVSALGTGTGGAGTYTLRTYQAAISPQETMTGGTVGSSSFWATASGRTLTVNSMISGTIVTGQVITGTGLDAGTTITSQQTGTTGLAGTYTIDVPQTVSSEAMTGAESRAEPNEIGGASLFNHAIYEQDNVVNSIVRRNAFVDTSSDGGNLKAGGIYEENLSLRNPNAFALGAGDIFAIDAPLGSYMDAGYNVTIGSNSVTGGAVGWGMRSSDNGRPTSLFHHNVIVRNDQVMTNGAFQIAQGTDNNNTPMPNFATFDHNVAYLWSTSGTTAVNSGGGTLTLTNNIWDDPTSGTNTNVGSVSFPNAYTETSLLAALPGAYASEAAAENDWVAHPENHAWEQAVTLALAGYGVTKAQQDLKADLRVTAGLAESGQFIGTLSDGYTISATGLPACMTIDDSSKTWRTDTSCTASSGTATVTETNGTNTHVTSLPWTIYNAPVLSGISVTPGTTTATINFSTTVGSGTAWAIVDPSTTATVWPAIRAGVTSTHDTGTPAVAKASASVTASGAQPSMNITGLTTATTYMLQIAQLDANNNPSAVYTVTFTTN